VTVAALHFPRVDERDIDNAARTPDRGDVTIEVWSPRPEPARTIGFAPRQWLLLAAAAALITFGLLLLTRRR